MKVLILPSWYPSDDNPINGIFFKEQAEALNEYIDVAVLNIRSFPISDIKNLLRFKNEIVYDENGMPTFTYEYTNFIPKNIFFKNKFYSMFITKAYKNVLSKWGKPDIIHAHVSYPAGYGALILSQRFGIPFIVTEHSTFFETRLMTKYGTYTKNVLENADYYSAVSSSLKDKIIKTGRKQCHVIPNFIKLDSFGPLEFNPRKSLNSSKTVNLLNISIMSEKKGIDILLKSLQKCLFYHKYNIHLHLVGDGPKREQYELLAHKLGVSDYCTFYGRLDDTDLKEVMKIADILVISSRIETFGVVGIEAMEYGIPVIATICGGPEDYIIEDVGMLVEKENVDSLSDGIIKMINEYEKYDPFLINKYVAENYSSKVVCNKILSVYAKILDL